MDMDKRIAEISAYHRKLYLTDDLTVQGLIDQLKACREECKGWQEATQAWEKGAGINHDESYEVSRKAQLKAEELSRGGP